MSCFLIRKVCWGKSFECRAQAGRITSALRDPEEGIDLEAELLPLERRSEFRCAHTGARLGLPGSHCPHFRIRGQI